MDRVTLRPALPPRNGPAPPLRPPSPSNTDYELADEAVELAAGPNFAHVVPHDAGLSSDNHAVSNLISNYKCVFKEEQISKNKVMYVCSDVVIGRYVRAGVRITQHACSLLYGVVIDWWRKLYVCGGLDAS